MKTIEADIFEIFKQKDNVILTHCSNCFNTMGSGIAKVIKDKYPKAYEADCRTEKGDKDKLGTYSFEKVAEKEKYIANLYGQYFYGRKELGDRDVSYDALYNAFQKLFKDIRAGNYCVLVPYGIGCGLAGGNWGIVEKMIDILANGYNIEVIVCKLT